MSVDSEKYKFLFEYQKNQFDKEINSAKGSIQFVKVISKKYDTKTKSATVTVGMTKENLAKNIKRWQNN